MTREEILKKFNVNEYDIIQNPGKFEGCAIYAPYFYDLVMNGASDGIIQDDFGCIKDVFNINDDDRKQFPELKNYKTVTISTSDDGFCLIETY